MTTLVWLLIGSLVAIWIHHKCRPRDWLETVCQGLFCAVFWPIVLAIFAFVKALED